MMDFDSAVALANDISSVVASIIGSLNLHIRRCRNGCRTSQDGLQRWYVLHYHDLLLY